LNCKTSFFAKIKAAELELTRKNEEINALKQKEVELLRKEEEIRALKERQNFELEKRLLEEKTKLTEQFQNQFDEKFKILLEQKNSRLSIANQGITDTIGTTKEVSSRIGKQSKPKIDGIAR